jgi:uncharacterized protein YfaS (alpha-2-macroglobulin family)
VSGHLSTQDRYTFAFTPVPAWQPGTTYVAHVKGVQGWKSFTFQTESFVTAYVPGAGAATVDPTAAIRLTFSYPVDCDSIETALQIHPETPYRVEWEDRTSPYDPEAPGDFLWEGQSLLLLPKEAWALDTTYAITLSEEASNVDGLPLGEAKQWTFKTRSGVLSFSPQGSPSWYDPIVVTFDRAVVQESAEAALQITPTIEGSFQWQDQTMRFLPTLGWESEMAYEVILAPSVRATDGTILLNQSLRKKFVARKVTVSVDFGYGPNLQVLDAAGPRLIQFSTWNSAPYVFGALYHITPEWLLSAYSSSFKGELEISPEGLPVAHSWTAETPQGEIALPAEVPPGLYVLGVGGRGNEQDHLIVVLTHYTAILKEAAVGVGSSAWHQVTGRVTSISTGDPSHGMVVRLYDRSANLVGETTTDTEGRFETGVEGDTDPLLVLGEIDGEWTICGFGSEWQAGGGWWDWRGWLTNPPTGRRFRSYVYTDRPIYRPGQTLYVKAVIRNDDDAIYSLPPTGTSVIVRLRDARDNVLSTQELSTGAFGTVDTSFNLAEGGTLGTYHVEVVVGEEVTRQALKVEEYRKPDYEVTVYTDRERCLEGEAITVTVVANYYFGQPVVGAPVSLKLYKRGGDYWECGSEANCWVQASRDEYGGITDAEGRWQMRLSGREWYDRLTTISLEATVRDDSGQSVSSHAAVQVHKYRHGTTLFVDRYAYKPGEDIPIALQVSDYEGNPVQEGAVHVKIYGWSGKNYNTPVAESDVSTDSSGRASATLHVNRQGWFRLVAYGYGEAETWIWVFDPTSPAPWDNPPEGLQVSVDKPSYAIGEVAQLLVRSPVTGPALLTLERGRVRQMQPIYLTEEITTIPIPIEADFAPNIFATVQVYQPIEREEWGQWASVSIPDANLLIASTELVVPVPEKRLLVTLTPDREQYGIREEAIITIQVTDANGRPVQAEVSLAMVDEAIYALSEDLALDPFEAFYSRRSNLVRTYHSLEPVRVLGGAERGGGGGGLDRGNPRRNFPDTAYWNPAILTDANGRAEVHILLPDSLTRWRLVARAVTLDTLAGEGTNTLTVAQPMVVRPAIPRFLVQGDRFTLTATLHNYSDNEIPVAAGLWAQGLALHGVLTHTLNLGAADTARVNWDLEATTLGTATVTAYARGADLSDAVQYTIPVVPYAVPQVTSFSGELIGERIERFHLPDDFIPEVTTLEVRLAPSVISSLLDGLEYLIGYPFG